MNLEYKVIANIINDFIQQNAGEIFLSSQKRFLKFLKIPKIYNELIKVSTNNDDKYDVIDIKYIRKLFLKTDKIINTFPFLVSRNMIDTVIENILYDVSKHNEEYNIKLKIINNCSSISKKENSTKRVLHVEYNSPKQMYSRIVSVIYIVKFNILNSMVKLFCNRQCVQCSARESLSIKHVTRCDTCIPSEHFNKINEVVCVSMLNKVSHDVQEIIISYLKNGSETYFEYQRGITKKYSTVKNISSGITFDYTI
jgi:hypothetical protein